MTEQIKRRQQNEIAECFAVIDTCLACYYTGAQHMYRPMAAQLRILFCDSPPLLSRVFPTFELAAVRPIVWLEPGEFQPFDAYEARIEISHPPDQQFRLARMPFVITKYSNGLQVADLEFEGGGQLLKINDWMQQRITIHPADVSIREVIRSVADKGGGAHVDDEVNEALKRMMGTGPAGIGVHVLFTVALGRLAQRIGLYYSQSREQCADDGDVQNIVVNLDMDHPSVENRAKIPNELLNNSGSLYYLTVLWRTR